MKQDQVKIKYYVSDGYARNRPQYLRVDKEEWDSLNEEEKETLIYETIIAEINFRWSVE